MIDAGLERHFPDVPHLEEGARRRIPKFVFEYVAGGTGTDAGVRRNREALEKILFTPRYTLVQDGPSLETTFLGQEFAAPFGVAPLGLSGLIWPRSARLLAQAARQHNLPYVLSNFGTDSLEKIAAIGGEHAWFQLYPPQVPEIERSHLERLKSSGYETMIVTVDTPTAHRRAHDIRNGLSVPPRIDVWAVLQMMSRPRWALEQLRYRPLTFENYERYMPAGVSLAERGQFLVDILDGHIHRDHLQALREHWPGKLIVKGIMHPADAELCTEVGADALVVSNHGGRQLDGAPATAQVLPGIRKAVGKGMPIIVDGGVRSGLDIARMLALGADFVLLGRAFAYAVAAAGERGAHHVMGMLMAELRIAMSQIGCLNLTELPNFLTDSVPQVRAHHIL